MEMVRAGHPARQLQALPRCACQSPVCPQEHGPTWSVAGDAGLIGLAVGVRRVVVLPVPRLRRRFSLAWPGRLRHSRRRRRADHRRLSARGKADREARPPRGCARAWHHRPMDPAPFLASLDAGTPIVLDGGLATQLEAMGEDLSDGLWSARLLADAPG